MAPSNKKASKSRFDALDDEQQCDRTLWQERSKENNSPTVPNNDQGLHSTVDDLTKAGRVHTGEKRAAERYSTPTSNPKKLKTSDEYEDLKTMQADVDPSSLYAADGLLMTRRSFEVMESEQPTPKCAFFLLPRELRDDIYSYLIPNRIHIAPPYDLRIQGDIKPWALASVSRQFRLEIRNIAYPPTPVNFHLGDDASITAYKTWIQGLPEGLEASLRHISIDEFVDINWEPDGPVPERPLETEDRCDRASYKADWIKSGKPREMVELYRLSRPQFAERRPQLAECFSYAGDWVLRWLQYTIEMDGNRMDPLERTLAWMEARRKRSDTPVAGLGKNGVRRLVRNYLANRCFYLLQFKNEEYEESETSEEEDQE
ncbi:MAG: hypothetical protein L6R38_008284 [Xanthoria sp. 2 TBL-2021]|nr:MAG: hypothetical protein L6R38_008284 [Xanthoria sp. 2 TBL-2021]